MTHGVKSAQYETMSSCVVHNDFGKQERVSKAKLECDGAINSSYCEARAGIVTRNRLKSNPVFKT